LSVYSDDGSTWTTGSDSFGGDLLGSQAKDLAFGLIAAGTSGFLVSSSVNGNLDKSGDGSSWSQLGGGASLVGTASVLCYAASLNRWVAAGNGGLVHTSDDYGATWQIRATPAGGAGSGGARRIVWSGSLFVVLPAGNPYDKFLPSPDGITWTERTVTSSRWGGLAYSQTDGGWLAVGNSSAKAWRSVDGLTWVDTAFTGPLGQCNDLATNGPLWIATGVVNTLAPAIAWSVDAGASWKRVSVGNHRVATVGFRRVILADDRFVAVHADGTNLEFALSLRSS